MEDVQPASATLEDEEAKKRRKYLQEVLEMEKIADNDDGDGDGEGANGSNGNANGGCNRGDEGDGDGDGDDDDTAELLRELEKIMRERAAEQARVGQAELEATEAEQEARISNANPLQILIPHWAIRSAPLL